MKLRYFSLLALFSLSLSGCVGTPAHAPASTSPAASGSPSPSSSSSSSPTPEPSSAPVLSIPASCTDLVPLSTVQAQFSPSFVHIPIDAGWGGPEVAEFQSRGGLTCLWGIPQSDAGSVWVLVAPLAGSMPSKLAEWQGMGLSECPPFLDGCYWEQVDYEGNGIYTTIHVLVGGFEMRIEAMGNSIDPLMVTARAAATSMGYV